MSDSEKVTAVHAATRLVSEIPRIYLKLFPAFRELSAKEINQRQRGKEKKLFGEYITPSIIKPTAARPDVAPNKEGGNK